jgi:hypothetical protein
VTGRPFGNLFPEVGIAGARQRFAVVFWKIERRRCTTGDKHRKYDRYQSSGKKSLHLAGPLIFTVQIIEQKPGYDQFLYLQYCIPEPDLDHQPEVLVKTPNWMPLPT